MAVINCKMCGSPLPLRSGATVVECEYCGREQTVPAMDNEKKLTLFARAERLRTACEFDKAAGVFEAIVADFPQEAEAYWGLVLCKYGIEYVDDPATGEKIPTCHRSSFDSVFDDPDYEQVYDNADVSARKVYRAEGKRIENVRRGIISVSANEDPYDIFICYKETAEDGNRTLDSVLAQDIYDALTDKGYRVFFARITLEDKLGQEYEPYIFAALNSAKIMLAVGTDFEYYNAVWVKNEWSRYLKLMTKDKNKHLIPCFKGLDAYDMPKEFTKLQAQDLGKVGAMQDLLRGIEKLLPRQKENDKDIPEDAESVKERVAVQQSTNFATTESLLKRAFMYLEDGDWSNADIYCERVLDMDPENGRAYLGKLLVELRVEKSNSLVECDKPFNVAKNYQRAYQYGDLAQRRMLDNAISQINERISNMESEKTYSEACKNLRIIEKMVNADWEHEIDKSCVYTISLFEKIVKYKDSAEMIERCKTLLYDHGLKLMGKAAVPCEFMMASRHFEAIPDGDNYRDVALLKRECCEKKNLSKLELDYCQANKSWKTGDRTSLKRAVNMFESLGDYKDSIDNLKLCREQLESEEQRIRVKSWQNAGKCQHCGGEFKGLFAKKCANCGRPKDY